MEKKRSGVSGQGLVHTLDGHCPAPRRYDIFRHKLRCNILIMIRGERNVFSPEMLVFGCLVSITYECDWIHIIELSQWNKSVLFLEKKIKNIMQENEVAPPRHLNAERWTETSHLVMPTTSDITLGISTRRHHCLQLENLKQIRITRKSALECLCWKYLQWRSEGLRCTDSRSGNYNIRIFCKSFPLLNVITPYTSWYDVMKS